MEDSDQPAKSAENQQTEQGMSSYFIYNLLPLHWTQMSNHVCFCSLH